ncbi:geranylgeranyl transferase type-2 subunit alpha 1 [Humulus lupulus]|uniref:geranylgeranyl transferase type-2 subunit alpha 1 n=1 Tax=Humulus lupulus TaxID=3486 RepID=UPI002B406F4D|nr:geranylgeranyl transferase type-2 subunit alpha 1 [Humulus lupulus]
MHGRPRKALKPEDEVASAAKAQKLQALQSLFLSNHHSRNYCKEALDVNAKLLEINPESYTAWNYRKLAVQHKLTQSDLDPDSVKSVLDEELRVVESALRQNFKSYGAWHHRKWVLSKGHSSIDYELRLLDRFQKADARNFHAWNYRRFVAALMKRSEEDELNYTTDMIDNNFSNYSAWHNRSLLLSSLLEKKVQGFSSKENALSDEIELVHQAIFTDPDDQSAWFYYLWLLDQTMKIESPLLISSWPTHGSEVTLLRERCRANFSLSSFHNLHSDSGIFLLILYFSEVVEGVSSTTVTVESSFFTNEVLIWKPLSTNNSNASKVWIAHVNFPNKELQHSETYSMEISLGHSQGITSSSGYSYSHHTKIAFKVCVQSLGKEKNEEQDEELISWKDENFHNFETQSPEPSPFVYFGKLNINEDHEPTASEWRAETITNEIALFRELLSEITCKIGKLTLARLMKAHDALLSQSANKTVHSEESLALYTDLIELDPFHSLYYRDAYSLVLLEQVTSSWESLLRYSYHYKRDLTLSPLGNSVCLRLNNLSLSRIGAIDKLLWVQVLDLSHNQLQSIEGLEAMQLLSCLNLSYNNLRSFTALAPLRPIRSLKVLDVSYNEIGSHSIDTTRYLCPSPLSHTEENSWNSQEVVTGADNVTKYWDAVLILKGLNLKQLDIKGNAIADEQFKSILGNSLPALKWLDGEVLH